MVAVAGKAQLTTEYTLRPQPTTEAAVLTREPILLHIVARVLHTLTYSLSTSLHSARAGGSHWVPGWGGSVGGRIGLHKIQATGGRSGCKRGRTNDAQAAACWWASVGLTHHDPPDLSKIFALSPPLGFRTFVLYTFLKSLSCHNSSRLEDLTVWWLRVGPRSGCE